VSVYVVLISGDEEVWAKRSESENAAVDAAHSAFSRSLAERGHRVLASHELGWARESRIARSDGDTVRFTDGPYAETVEQLGGLYLVESTDLDDLMELAGELARTERAVEVRPTMGHE
jgi:hypothetical protein